MDLKSFKSDTAKESEGVWQPIGEGTEFLIARMNNPATKAAFRKMTSRYRGQALEMMPERKQEEIYARVLADTVLLDWRETVGGKLAEHTITLDSKKVKFSPEKAFEILSDPAYGDLLQIVRIYTEDGAAYRENAIEEASGNLPAA